MGNNSSQKKEGTKADSTTKPSSDDQVANNPKIIDPYAFHKAGLRVNVLFTWDESTVMELLFDSEQLNTRNLLLIHGFVRSMNSNEEIDAINDIVIDYSIIFVDKYQVTITKQVDGGQNNETTNENDDSAIYTHYQSAHEQDIANCDVHIVSFFPSANLPVRSKHGKSSFDIRVKAVFVDGTSSAETDLFQIQTISLNRPVRQPFRQSNYNYHLHFNDFWDQHFKEKTEIDMNEWLCLWNEKNKCELSEYDLKRLYYYLSKGTNDNISKDEIGRFLIVDVYEGIHGKGFRCAEWPELRGKMRTSIPNLENYAHN